MLENRVLELIIVMVILGIPALIISRIVRLARRNPAHPPVGWQQPQPPTTQREDA